MSDRQASYLPQLTDYEDIPLTKEGVLHELQTAATQSWIRALANFQVLGSPVVLGGLQHQEQRPLWSKRVRDISTVPALFKAITRVKTDRGLMWERILTVRQVLTKEGKVTVAVGHGSSYEELEGPTKIAWPGRGLVCQDVGPRRLQVLLHPAPSLQV